MFKKKNAKKGGCLRRLLILVILIVVAFFTYKFIDSWGSAKFEITSLHLSEKLNKSGEPISGSLLVKLELKNTGSEEGLFCMDIDNYIEARKLEGKSTDDIPKVWYFSTEFYFPTLNEWQAIVNGEYWSGEKMTPGALKVNVPEDAVINLEAYLKNSRGWKLQLPNAESEPSKIRITLYKPGGQVVQTEERPLGK